MDETIWSIALKSIPIDAAHGLISGLMGATALLVLLRFMDWTTGGPRTSAHLAIIETDPKAIALYRGLRLIACALIMGWAASK